MFFYVVKKKSLLKIPNANDAIFSYSVADYILTQSFLETIWQHVPRLRKVLISSEYFSVRECFRSLKHVGKLGDDYSYTLAAFTSRLFGEFLKWKKDSGQSLRIWLRGQSVVNAKPQKEGEIRQ